ncbi:MAG: hypothetical protein ACI8YI_002003, partial [Paracoccaceae bacterium]
NLPDFRAVWRIDSAVIACKIRPYGGCCSAAL